MSDEKNPWEMETQPVKEESGIPQQTPEEVEAEYQQLIGEWHSTAQKLKALKIKESTLRKRIVAHYFPNPKEGVNKVDMPAGWILQLDHSITRNIDEAALPSVLKDLPEGSEDTLIKYKPSLNLKEYRKLQPEHKTKFEEALIIKDGSPQAKLVPPKEK